MNRPYVVGIGGGTCSGKTSFANLLAESLKPEANVAVFHMDTYFLNPGITTIAPITGIEYVEHNHPDAFRLDDLYAEFHVAAADSSIDFVLMEGLFALYLEPIRQQCDLKIFMDLESDERLVRRITKFMARGQSFKEVTDRYIDTVRFRHNELIEPTRWHADIVVNGTFEHSKAAEVVLNYLRAQKQ